MFWKFERAIASYRTSDTLLLNDRICTHCEIECNCETVTTYPGEFDQINVK